MLPKDVSAPGGLLASIGQPQADRRQGPDKDADYVYELDTT
jgi:hypothetical protein